MPAGGRPPLKVTWTFADGSKLGPDDDHTVARMFRKMVDNLTKDELRALDCIVRRKLAGEPLRQLQQLSIQNKASVEVPREPVP